MTSIEFAKKIRLTALEMAYTAKSSHVGGILSVADIVAVLYHDIARYNVHNPRDEERDRIVLSKGHCCAAVYAALAG